MQLAQQIMSIMKTGTVKLFTRSTFPIYDSSQAEENPKVKLSECVLPESISNVLCSINILRDDPDGN